MNSQIHNAGESYPKVSDVGFGPNTSGQQIPNFSFNPYAFAQPPNLAMPYMIYGQGHPQASVNLTSGVNSHFSSSRTGNNHYSNPHTGSRHNNNDHRHSHGQSSTRTEDLVMRKDDSPWSLHRLSNGKIPYYVQKEYDDLIDKHKNKKKVEQNFFQQKVTDYVATLKGEKVDVHKHNGQKFSEISLVNSTLLKNLESLNFITLTAIQQTTIPLTLTGQDLIGCSDTGSGKTIAFLLPILCQMMNKTVELVDSSCFPSITCPYVLILAPTRELAEQINEEARKVIYSTGMHSVAIYGGIKIYEQSKKLSYGCEILVATPGRLIDMLKQGKVTLKFVRFLVLDEADEMLNMGFLPQIKEIINSFDLCDKSKRQNLMFSATFETEVQNLAKSLMNEYYFVSNGTGSGNKDSDFNNSSVSKWKIKENIIQIVEPAKDQDYKIKYICNIMRENPSSGAIVFVDKKDKVDYIKSQFNYNKLPATSIHGDKAQNIRQFAIDEFKKGRYKVIVATNILARGLDFVDVDYVFNFDLPMNIEDYIHRIGRTGRLGGQGYAVTFIEREDKFKKITKDLISYIRKCGKEVPEWLGCLFPNQSNHFRYGATNPQVGNYNFRDQGLNNSSNSFRSRDQRKSSNSRSRSRSRDRSRNRSRDRSRSRSSTRYRNRSRSRSLDRRVRSSQRDRSFRDRRRGDSNNSLQDKEHSSKRLLNDSSHHDNPTSKYRYRKHSRSSSRNRSHHINHSHSHSKDERPSYLRRDGPPRETGEQPNKSTEGSYPK